MPIVWRRFIGWLPLLLLLHIAPSRAELLSASDARIYREAFAAAEAEHWSAALHEAARARDRRLATVLQWIEVTHGGASFSDITAFIAAHPDWPSPKLLRERAEQALAGASDAAASAWFAEHPPMTMAGKLRKADLLMDQGRTAAADGLVRDVWIDGDLTKFEEKSLLQRYHGILRRSDHEARLDQLLWDHRIESAQRMLRLVGPRARELAETRIALDELDPGAESRLARLSAAELQTTPASFTSACAGVAARDFTTTPSRCSMPRPVRSAIRKPGRSSARFSRAMPLPKASRKWPTASPRGTSSRPVRISPSWSFSPAGSLCVTSTNPTLRTTISFACTMA